MQVVHQPHVAGLDLVPVVAAMSVSRARTAAPGRRRRRRRPGRTTGDMVAVLPRGSPRSRPGGSRPRQAVRCRLARRTSHSGSGRRGRTRCHADQPGDTAPGEAAEQSGEVLGVATASIAAKSGASGPRPAASIASSSMKLAYRSAILAVVAARGSPVDAGDDVAYGGLGLVSQLDECSGHRLVRRDLGIRQPAAVDVAEQVVLYPDVGVEGGEVQGGSGGGRLSHPAMLASAASPAEEPSPAVKPARPPKASPGPAGSRPPLDR